MILAGGFLLGSLAFGNGIEYATGALVGILLTPDLDVDNGYIGNTIIRNRMGRMAEMAWNVLWFPYRKSIKHGSPLSHWLIVGTLGRLAYLYFFLISIPYAIMGIFVPFDVGYELRWWFDLALQHYQLILALMGSDLIHFALDVLTKEHVKQKRKVEVFGLPLASSTC